MHQCGSFLSPSCFTWDRPLSQRTSPPGRTTPTRVIKSVSSFADDWPAVRLPLGARGIRVRLRRAKHGPLGKKPSCTGGSRKQADASRGRGPLLPKRRGFVVPMHSCLGSVRHTSAAWAAAESLPFPMPHPAGWLEEGKAVAARAGDGLGDRRIVLEPSPSNSKPASRTGTRRTRPCYARAITEPGGGTHQSRPCVLPQSPVSAPSGRSRAGRRRQAGLRRARGRRRAAFGEPARATAAKHTAD
jgi:hypothetical protein